MAKSRSKFDTTKPHTHSCPQCYKPVYCAGVNCEIPQVAECAECRRGAYLIRLDGTFAYAVDVPRRFDDDDEPRYY